MGPIARVSYSGRLPGITTTNICILFVSVVCVCTGVCVQARACYMRVTCYECIMYTCSARVCVGVSKRTHLP